MKKNTIIEVIWYDITSENTWLSEDDAKRFSPALCKTLGYYLNSRKGFLRLSDSISEDKGENDRNITVIPWGCVKNIKKL